MKQSTKVILSVLVAFNVIVVLFAIGNYKHATCGVSVSPTGKCWTEVVNGYNFDPKGVMPKLQLPEQNFVLGGGSTLKVATSDTQSTYNPQETVNGGLLQHAGVIDGIEPRL